MELNELQNKHDDLVNELNTLREEISSMQYRTKELDQSNKQLEQQVRQLTEKNIELLDLQHDKDELFSLIMDNIENPAKLIKKLVDLLTSYDENAKDKMSIVDELTQTSSKIISLSHEVTRFIAFESTKLDLEFDRVQTNYVMEDVARLNNKKAEDSDITISTDLKKDLPESVVDPQRLFEIVDNLIYSSLKFTHEGGNIVIRTSIDDQENIVYEVIDNGFGLSNDDIEHAFRKEDSDPMSLLQDPNSSGLGLWIVKQLVDAHNGKIWIKSSLGKGASYRFALPINRDDFDG